MKRYRLINSILLLVLLLATGGCTRNNGDIGPLFGNWRLDSMKADGEEVELYDDTTLLYVWAFQSSLVKIQTVQPHNDYRWAMGTWTLEGNTLSLDFNHTDIDGDYNYSPPAPLHLEGHGITPLHVTTLTGSCLKAEYTAPTGVKYEYTLHKAY